MDDIELKKAIEEGIADIKNGDFIEFGSIKEFHEKLAKYKD